MTADCTRTTKPTESLAAIVAELPAGATLCLEPGRYVGRVTLKQAVTIAGRGAGPGDVVLDGDLEGRVITVNSDAPVALRNLTITGGRAPEGGGLLMEGEGALRLEDCVVQGNTATGVGGGGLYVRRGATSLSRCRLEGNRATLGGGLLADVVADVTLSDTVVSGNTAKAGAGLAARDDAKLVGERFTVTDNDGASAVEVVGNTRRTPEVSLAHGTIAHRVGAAVSGGKSGADRVSVTDCTVVGALTGVGRATGNR